MQIHVVGIGNEWAGDDGLGPAVVRRAQTVYERRYGQDPSRPVTFTTLTGSPLDLLEMSRPDDLLIIVDAVSSGAAPGTVHQIEWEPGCLAARGREAAACHGWGVREALALASALGRLPARVLLWGVEVAVTEPGTGLTAGFGSIEAPLWSNIVEELLEMVVDYHGSSKI